MREWSKFFAIRKIRGTRESIDVNDVNWKSVLLYPSIADNGVRKVKVLESVNPEEILLGRKRYEVDEISGRMIGWWI